MARVTTTDIARDAGVSQTTVSFVLNEKENASIPPATRQKVLDAAQRLGYNKAERAKAARRAQDGAKKTGLIGLLVPNLINLFFTSVVRYVERFASLNGYEVVVMNIERNVQCEQAKLDGLIKRGVDGIVVAYTPGDIDHIRQIRKRTPVVILGESPTDCGVQTIGINGYKCGEMMAAHLFELGHRDIAMLTAPVRRISLTRPRRIEGARTFLERRGAADGFFVVEDDDESEYDEIYEFTIGYKLTRQLVRSGRRFTAIMCSDMNAPGVYSVLGEEGLHIPQDVSVVGIDNTFVGKIISPQLTTIDHHLKERCKLALEYLVECIRAGGEQMEGYLVEYSPSLIMRHSTIGVLDASRG